MQPTAPDPSATRHASTLDGAFTRRGALCSAVVLGLTLGLPLLGACGGAPPRVANPTRPLDERRAIEIIIGAFRDEKEPPVPGEKVDIAGDHALEIDVKHQSRKWAVAYLTSNERQKMGGAVPERTAEMGDALQLVSARRGDDVYKVLVLHDTSYVYDDQVGTEHEQTSITAERRLKRDVRDFLVRARTERWP